MTQPLVRASAEDLRLAQALLDGDEAAFRGLMEAYGPQMLRLARMFVPSIAVAEEVVQEAWIGILKGLPGFEGRSSLRTWMLRIVVNTAKTRGQREGRSVPFSSLGTEDEPPVDPDRFVRGGGDAGHWTTFPADWESLPEGRLLSSETLDRIRAAIDALPPAHATVIRLRDVQGWDSAEVCNALSISETNQRVLLHRARSKVRRALERYLDGGPPA